MKRAAVVAIVLAAAAVVALRYAWPEPAGAGTTPGATPATPVANLPASVGAKPRHERAAAPNAEPLPSGDFANDRIELDRRARAGDSKAALRLAGILTKCPGYRPVSDAELEDRVVDGLARQRQAPTVDGKPLPPEVLIEYAQRNQRERNALCAGTKETDFDPEGDRETALRLLQRAADAGDLDAMLEYGTLDFIDLRMNSQAWLVDHAEAIRERKQRVSDYLGRVLASGDARALRAYGNEYLYGRLFPRDPSKAYAYYYAFSRSAAGTESGPWMSRMPLQFPASELSPEQLTRAQSEGLALLAQCCGVAEPAR